VSLFCFYSLENFYPVYFNRWLENCPQKCKRSKTTRVKRCFADYKYFTAPSNDICLDDLTKEVECLDLTGCTGTRLYLATKEMSCEDFCVNQGKTSIKFYPCQSK